MSVYVDTILAAKENLLVYRADSLTVVINLFEDEANTIPYDDLTTWTDLKLTIRENYESLDEIVVLELGSGIAVVANEMTLTFTSEHMDLLNPNYVYDIQGTTGTIIGTVLRGMLKRDNDVTR